MNASIGSVRGTPSTSASMLAPKLVCSWVCLYRLFSTTLATASRLSTMTRRWPVRPEVSSRMSAMPVTRPSLTVLGDLLRQAVGVDLVGQLGDDQALPVLDLLDLDDRAHDDRAAAGAVGVLDALAAHDQRAGREVRALDLAPSTASSSSSRVRLGVRERPLRRPRPPRAGCAAGCWVAMPTAMPARAVDQQVREPARQDVGLEGLAVVVGPEVDGLLVDVAHHLHGQRRHPALGVPRGGGRVVARAAEVALPVHQRVAQRPVLHEPHQGVVDRLVTVRVVLAHDLADDAAALVEAAVGPVATVVHRVDDPAVHRLEAVAHVRAGPG